LTDFPFDTAGQLYLSGENPRHRGEIYFSTRPEISGAVRQASHILMLDGHLGAAENPLRMSLAGVDKVHGHATLLCCELVIQLVFGWFDFTAERVRLKRRTCDTRANRSA
jgi:hypothetical protein